jgi:nicotinamidase-related amidase
LADAMDGQGLAGRGGAREPSSRTNRFHPLHPARASRPDAGHVAALRLLELMPPLAALCPPATVIDKTRYSTLAEPKLAEHLRQREADALIVSGSETDVCVLATVLNAVNIGYRVIVVRDAVCSSSDEGHDMLMRLHHARYTEQIETADAATILTRWE